MGAALVLAFVGLQYGQVLAWQIRAQNAADAAASAALSVQSTTFNQQTMILYAAGVEEYRIRNLLEAMTAAASNDPGCSTDVIDGGCTGLFVSLRQQYYAAVYRYIADVNLMNGATQYSLSAAESDAKAIVQQLGTNCGKAKGGDCAFSYTVTGLQKRIGQLNDVEQDGGDWAVNTGAGNPAVVKDDYVPAQIEIVACANVAPIVPSFPGFTPPTFQAVGRAAATAAMVTEEWMEPGTILNPATGKLFQPLENFGLGTTATGPNVAGFPAHNWFTTDYGGNSAVANPAGDSYSEKVQQNEFSAVTGWWSTIPLRPFTGALSAASYSCASD
jgi:hypothetical protein